MTYSLHFLLLPYILIMALNACTGSEQKKPSTTAPRASNSSDKLAHLTPVIMLQPEKSALNGINDPDIPGPQQLLGLYANDIHTMFGKPDFKHQDSPAEIWQYRKESCLLDIFLYFKKDRPYILHVRHAEVRGRSIAKVSPQKCFLEALRR